MRKGRNYFYGDDGNNVDFSQRYAGSGMAGQDGTERVVKAARRNSPPSVQNDPVKTKRLEDEIHGAMAGYDTTPEEDAAIRQTRPEPDEYTEQAERTGKQERTIKESAADHAVLLSGMQQWAEDLAELTQELREAADASATARCVPTQIQTSKKSLSVAMNFGASEEPKEIHSPEALKKEKHSNEENRKNKQSECGSHGAGGQLARPGTIAAVSAIGRKRPITASRNPQRPVAPVRSDAETSSNIERIISRPENQLSNPYGVVRVPAPANQTNQRTQVAGLPAKGIYGTGHGGYNVTNVGCGNTQTTKEALAATGDTLPGGYNSINNFRGSGSKRQAGRPGNPSRNTSAKENARMRQTGY